MGSDKQKLSDSERIDRLRLIRTSDVGPRIFRQLLDRFGSAAAALDALPALARKSGKPGKYAIPSPETVHCEMRAAEAAGAQVVAPGEPGYPTLLAEIDDPPPLLYIRGDTHLFDRPAIAIVGARNASSHGRRLAAEIAADLGAAGCIVVSGLARGIDGAAHAAALPTGTIAAVAGGIDIAYPPEHAALQAQIAENGVLVSEQPVGTTPTARHFPARNRLISGLSSGVLVVEAALKSGSLITARLALEQGREVFAVPGSPRDPRCRGTNDLLRQGAVLVESAADVLQAVAAQLAPRTAPKEKQRILQPPDPKADFPSDSAQDRLIGLLGATPTGVDELVRECHMSAAAVRTALLELELAGRIERHPGDRVSLVL
mgnify:CR=1 FL=1